MTVLQVAAFRCEETCVVLGVVCFTSSLELRRQRPDSSWLYGRVDGQARLPDSKTDGVVARFTEQSDVFTSI